MDILEKVAAGHVLVDGAMGTMLQKYGLPTGVEPEYFNLTHPEIVEKIHREYLAAGADVITANTFQANRTKLPQEKLPEIITRAVQIAQAAGAPFTAYDMGPVGQLLAPMGTLSFEDAYDIFKEQALLAESAGADLVIIETMSDLLETKAAILAIKEHTKLPIFCTMTYQEDGRTFVGTDPVAATLTLQALGADAVGVNCSLGPVELLPIVQKILKYALIPVIVQANAGLPQMENGATVYRIEPAEYTKAARAMIRAGVRIIGGCCGTTPEFIQEMRAMLMQEPVAAPAPVICTAPTSASQAVILDDRLSVIGERINPTGKPRLKAALREQDLSYLLKEALAQVKAGADILDVNVGLPEIDEAKTMTTVVQEMQGIVNVPLQIDSSQVAAIESGARHYNGRPLINSVNGKPESLEAILPIVKKYGALILGLCLDESGIPDNAEGRVAIARKIVETAESYGIRREDVLIDPLVLTASAQQEQVAVTLETIRLLKTELGVKTVIGLSNVSFGLPERTLLNASFLAAAFGAGVDAPIMNPLSDWMMATVSALRVFNRQDENAAGYIERMQTSGIQFGGKTAAAAGVQKVTGDSENLKQMIIEGRKDETAAKARELLKSLTPLEIVDRYFIPALNVVGDAFEKKTLFLPQLMQSAEAVTQAQNVLKDYLAKQEAPQESNGRILLATVEGDIHDIGKNIVKMILENYGFDIIDLGRDVPIEKVVETLKKEKIHLAGLSALMTTTVANMKKTIAAVKAAGLDVTFMVGGAVLNPEYKEFVGADYYAKDAMESVAIAQKFFKEHPKKK